MKIETTQIKNSNEARELADLGRKILAKIRKALAKFFFPRAEMTYEQWESLERHRSRHSPSHGQIFYGDWGL